MSYHHAAAAKRQWRRIEARYGTKGTASQRGTPSRNLVTGALTPNDITVASMATPRELEVNEQGTGDNGTVEATRKGWWVTVDDGSDLTPFDQFTVGMGVYEILSAVRDAFLIRWRVVSRRLYG